MRDCARRAVSTGARMPLKHFVKNCVPLQHRQAARFRTARKRLVERCDFAVAEHELAGRGVVGGMLRRSRFWNCQHRWPARQKRQRDLARRGAMRVGDRLQQLRLPRCAADGKSL